MDLLVLKVLQSYHSPFWDAFFINATRLGEDLFYLPLLAGLYWCFCRETGIRIGLAFFFSIVTNSLLKVSIARARPIGCPGVRTLYAQTATGFSFPSGHTQNATTFWRSAAIHIRRPLVGIIGLMVIFLVGFSRVYLGVHWPSDVVGGVLAGFLVAEGYAWLEQRLNARHKIILLTMAGIVLHLAILWQTNYQYLAAGGLFIGGLAGTLWERRYIRFEAKTGLRYQIIKLALGVGVLLLLRSGMKLLMPHDFTFGVYLRYLMIGLWVAGGAPWVFVRWGLTPRQE